MDTNILLFVMCMLTVLTFAFPIVMFGYRSYKAIKRPTKRKRHETRARSNN